MKKLIFAIFLIISAVVYSQIPYYFYQVPSGTTSNLNDLWLYSNSFYITGNDGILLRSPHYDSSWTSVNTGTTVNLFSFIKYNSTLNNVLGSNGIILKRNGTNWIPFQTNLNVNLYSGTYSSFKYILTGPAGKIYRKSIVQPDTSYITIQTPTSNDLKSSCSYSNLIWVAGNGGVILLSNDTGSTWTPQVSGTTNNINCITFKNSSLGFAVGDNGTILKTTNGGINWVQKTSNTTSHLNKLDLTTRYSTEIGANIYIAGNNVLLYSLDTGNTWSQYSGVPQYNFNAFYRFQSDYWGHTKDLCLGEGGKIYKRMIDTSYHVNQGINLLPNNINSIFYYSGIFDQDYRTSNTPGFEWPKGSGKHAIFTAGLCIAAYKNGELREAMASYWGEYRPGYCVNGNYYLNDYFKIYKVSKSDVPQQNWDWMNWGQMIPYGAPYIDVNHNSIYEPLIDTPGVKNARETIFLCMTDANPQSHTAGEGFGAGTLPLGAEVHMTAWAYDSPGLQDVQFISYDIVNKSGSVWNKVKMGIYSDPDLGNMNDDYIGCDTNLQLSYCYNGTNNDMIYGANPPAVGLTLLKGPLNRTVMPNIRLKMITFGYVGNIASWGTVCETRANGEPYAAYLMMSGFKKDSTCWLDPTQSPPKKTKFVYTGDPETNTGWNEAQGRIGNCNRDSTGIVLSNSPYDKMFYFTSGADNFHMQPGESNKFVIAQLIARGTSNLNSVTRLKQLTDSVRTFYETNFPIGIRKVADIIPEKFNLFQNYPNPFNPVTNIKYQIPRYGGSSTTNSLVTLKVYDILGREVETLVNEFQQAGVYEVQFPGSSGNAPASGIYFYKITAGDYSAVKRMVMIK